MDKKDKKEYHRNYRLSTKGKEVVAKASLKYRQSEHGKRKRKLNTERYRSTLHGHMQHLWAQTKLRAEKKGLNFNLTPQFLKDLWESQEGLCKITHRPMTHQKGIGRHNNNVSLDRMIPEDGYVETNVRLVCDAVNMMRNNKTDEELEKWCLDILEGLHQKKRPIPNFSTVADVLDRLIVELMKLSFYEQGKRDEQSKETPDPVRVAFFDDNSRDACEFRALLKNKLNELLHQIVVHKTYSPLKELRTFRPPSRSVDEIIEEMIDNNLELKKELAESLEYELRELNIKDLDDEN